MERNTAILVQSEESQVRFNPLEQWLLVIIADVTFYPIGRGTSAGDIIRDAVIILSEAGVKCYPNSMATVIEANSMADIFRAIEKAESFIISKGFQRVETIIKIDHRTDRENSVEHKLSRIGVGDHE